MAGSSGARRGSCLTSKSLGLLAQPPIVFQQQFTGREREKEVGVENLELLCVFVQMSESFEAAMGEVI